MKADKVVEMLKFMKGVEFGFHLDVKGPNKKPFVDAEFPVDKFSLAQVPFTDEFDVKVIVDIGDLFALMGK